MYSSKVISSSELAESLLTNAVVVRRLLKDLREGGIVESVAGPNGGFRLGMKADKINLWEIYLIMREEDFFQRPKVNPDCVVSSNLRVLVHDAFTQAELGMKTTLENSTVMSLTLDLKRMVGD